ncbi:DNA-binding protein [Pasteurella multocida]|uniref:DNA-binding protein n=1 Tax=Pasteurella multocida TaxID=747 RepID=UPI000ACE4AE7|nr:DNA-binding protein [Pasteurella multocida]HEH9720114.1 ci repressor-like protein [Pasteurella multocida]HEH9818895.1 ci repressor-like protein [Pasteurella multocida]
MIQEWLELKNILGVAGLPETVQGVTKKAKLENWQRRLIKGRKGKTFEYYVGDMPPAVQQALGFKPNEAKNEPLPIERVDERLESIDRIMAAISSLEAKVKELEEPTLDSLPDTLDQAEKRLVRWFRQCNQDRQAMLLSSAEVLADMSLKEQKESSEPLENCEVA